MWYVTTKEGVFLTWGDSHKPLEFSFYAEAEATAKSLNAMVISDQELDLKQYTVSIAEGAYFLKEDATLTKDKAKAQAFPSYSASKEAIARWLEKGGAWDITKIVSL